jgi:hypothetical protein
MYNRIKIKKGDLKMHRGFSKITKNMQEAYEQGTKGSQDKTPEICGYYGRACRQMDKDEGANRVLCQGCGLARYCE